MEYHASYGKVLKHSRLIIVKPKSGKLELNHRFNSQENTQNKRPKNNKQCKTIRYVQSCKALVRL